MKKVLCPIIVLAMLCSVFTTAFAIGDEGEEYNTVSYNEEAFFESVSVNACYLKGDKIYAHVEFENIVGEFKLVMAVYDDEDVLCSVKSFDISYMDSYYELEITANGGDRVNLFLWKSVFGLEPICEVKANYIPAKYGYLLEVAEENEEIGFEIFTTGCEARTFECAEEIAIDEEIFIEGDKRIVDRLEFSAESANKSYPDERNTQYHQPIMYALNEYGEIAHIDTVVSSVNEKISKLADSKSHYSAYSYSQYKSRNFGEFKVGQDTLFFIAPDDRSNIDGYSVYRDFLGTFINDMSYHVEAYGLDEDKVASLVMVYKELPDMDDYYPSSSPMMIVKSKVSKTDGSIYITGYTGTSYSLKHVDVNLDAVESVASIGKGDIIRYKTDNYNKVTGYQIWYDASDAVQTVACNDIDSAIKNRILEINASSLVPVVNTPNASFRLQYGTVYALTLSDEGDSICVTPSIATDTFDMVTEGNGVIKWEIDSSVKVYEYADGEVLTEADLKEIVPGKTEVIAYSSQGELRALYIMKKPYVSEKKIATVQTITKRATGYEIIGYSDGERLIATVSEENEPIVESIVSGNIIAYVPEGDTIKDIEVVFASTKSEFAPADGEALIAATTDEILVFGLSEYTADGAVINGVEYTVTDDTNYLLMKYSGNIVNYGVGKHMEMKNEYVLIRVKADKPTQIADVVIFQELG